MPIDINIINIMLKIIIKPTLLCIIFVINSIIALFKTDR